MEPCIFVQRLLRSKQAEDVFGFTLDELPDKAVPPSYLFGPLLQARDPEELLHQIGCVFPSEGNSVTYDSEDIVAKYQKDPWVPLVGVISAITTLNYYTMCYWKHNKKTFRKIFNEDNGHFESSTVYTFKNREGEVIEKEVQEMNEQEAYNLIVDEIETVKEACKTYTKLKMDYMFPTHLTVDEGQVFTFDFSNAPVDIETLTEDLNETTVEVIGFNVYEDDRRRAFGHPRPIARVIASPGENKAEIGTTKIIPHSNFYFTA